MRKLTPLMLLLILFVACDSKSEQEGDEDAMDTTEMQSDTEPSSSMDASLEKLWETDTILTTSESVLYDKSRNRLYVSNINGQPLEKDGNGFISALNLDGEVTDVYLFSGYLDAPKGMAIKDNKLYVTDINRIVEININESVSTKSWEIDTAKFLNDAVKGPDGTLYFSDSQTNTIYQLKGEDMTVFLNSDKLNGPNGLQVDNKTMMVTTMNGGQVLKINMDDKSIEEMTTGIGAGDGIVPLGDGRYLASSWTGKVFLVDQQGNKKNLLDTEAENINSADIEYIPEQNLLLVPTFQGNSVVAYKLNSN